MQSASNRSVIIISGLLTLVLLIGGTLALGLRHGWAKLASEAPASDAVTARVQPEAAGGSLVAASARSTQSQLPDNASEAETLLYRQKLEEAYRALDEAYAQIQSLQTSQSQITSRGGDHDDDDHGDRRSRRRRSDDD